ncbi:MAG: hypothetical protein RLY93_09690 [Sumerlaeia bacterium]
MSGAHSSPAAGLGRFDCAVVCGRNDHPHFVEGWHDRERDGRCGVSYRAANGSGLLRLRRQPGARRLHLLLSGPAGLTPSPLAGLLAFPTSQSPPHPLSLHHDQWALREIALPGDLAGDTIDLRLTLESPPCPDEVLRNGDGRRLGWYVAGVWQG